MISLINYARCDASWKFIRKKILSDLFKPLRLPTKTVLNMTYLIH